MYRFDYQCKKTKTPNHLIYPYSQLNHLYGLFYFLSWNLRQKKQCPVIWKSFKGIYNWTSFRMNTVFHISLNQRADMEYVSQDPLLRTSTITLHTKRRHCWWTFKPRGIINPIVSVAELTWFIIYTVKPVHAVTSIKQPPVLKGHIFLDLS
jgi:hypothetical protein